MELMICSCDVDNFFVKNGMRFFACHIKKIIKHVEQVKVPFIINYMLTVASVIAC